jgi:hypothetical protein
MTPTRQPAPRALPRTTAIPLLALVLLSSAGCSLIPEHTEDPAPIVRGPEPARLQHPLALNFLAFRPRRAVTQPSGTTDVAWDSAYSSIYFSQKNGPDESVMLDGELWTNAIRTRHGIGEHSDIEFEVGVLRAGGGFLDPFVNDWHRAFGFPDGGRNNAKDNSYEMQIRANDQSAYELESHHIGLLDIPIVWTQSLMEEDEDQPAVALRFGVELPTGNENKGFSNGEVDYGLGVLVERSVGRWTFTGATDYVFTERSDDFEKADIQMDDLWDVQAGAEYRWNDSGSLLAQLVYTSPLVRDIPLDAIDSPILDLGVGAVWDHSERSRITLTFHEDLIADAGPDFGFALSWVWRFD